MDTSDDAVKFFENNKHADIMLIEMSADNIDAAKKIYNISSVPIIVQSSDSQSNDDRQTVLQSGCTEYLAKPFSATKLLSTIDNLLVKKRT